MDDTARSGSTCNTVITNASAPSSYSYPMSIPAGATAAAQTDGSITVTGDSGNLVGAMSPAWAVDANGSSVPSHHELSGATVTQVVDSAGTQAFPVAADPWFGKVLVKKVQCRTRTRTMLASWCSPTSWGRVRAGSLTCDAHRNEVLSTTPDHKSRANTNDMKLQLWCHLDLGAQFWKDSYNLDTSLHRGRLDAHTLHRCNQWSKLMQRIWSWITVLLGIAVITITYIEAMVVGVWFDDHGLPDDVTSTPEILLGIVGLILIAGGLIAALTKPHSVRR